MKIDAIQNGNTQFGEKGALIQSFVSFMKWAIQLAKMNIYEFN